MKVKTLCSFLRIFQLICGLVDQTGEERSAVMYTLHNATHSNKKTHTGMVSDDNTMVLNDYYCIFMVFPLRFRTIGFIYVGFF